MLIYCSRNISDYCQCGNQLCWLIFVIFVKSFVTLENVFVTFDESLMNKSMNLFSTVLLFLLYIEYMYILITPNVWALVSSASCISEARTHRLEGSWWRRSVRTKPAAGEDPGSRLPASAQSVWHTIHGRIDPAGCLKHIQTPSVSALSSQDQPFDFYCRFFSLQTPHNEVITVTRLLLSLLVSDWTASPRSTLYRNTHALTTSTTTNARPAGHRPFWTDTYWYGSRPIGCVTCC